MYTTNKCFLKLSERPNDQTNTHYAYILYHTSDNTTSILSLATPNPLQFKPRLLLHTSVIRRLLLLSTSKYLVITWRLNSSIFSYFANYSLQTENHLKEGSQDFTTFYWIHFVITNCIFAFFNASHAATAHINFTECSTGTVTVQVQLWKYVSWQGDKEHKYLSMQLTYTFVCSNRETVSESFNKESEIMR